MDACMHLIRYICVGMSSTAIGHACVCYVLRALDPAISPPRQARLCSRVERLC